MTTGMQEGLIAWAGGRLYLTFLLSEPYLSLRSGAGGLP
jgi:hypothetical protein